MFLCTLTLEPPVYQFQTATLHDLLQHHTRMPFRFVGCCTINMSILYKYYIYIQYIHIYWYINFRCVIIMEKLTCFSLFRHEFMPFFPDRWQRRERKERRGGLEGWNWVKWGTKDSNGKGRIIDLEFTEKDPTFLAHQWNLTYKLPPPPQKKVKTSNIASESRIRECLAFTKIFCGL